VSKVKKPAMRAGVRNVKGQKKSVKTTAASKVEVRELDPIRKCGPGTSVRVLLRVIERLDGKSMSHLVFFDKYGWYCEHGRSCPAVAHARKQRRHLASSARR
jgi:hypothetical protein